MKRADRQLTSQRLKGQGRVLLQQPAGLRHFVDPLLLRIVFIRLAAFARAEPRRHGSGDVGKKAHVFPPRTTRAAGRAAADTGGQYRKDKLTIGPGITFADRLPAAVIGIGNYRFHDEAPAVSVSSVCGDARSKKPAILLFNFSRRRGRCETVATSRF